MVRNNEKIELICSLDQLNSEIKKFEEGYTDKKVKDFIYMEQMIDNQLFLIMKNFQKRLPNNPSTKYLTEIQSKIYYTILYKNLLTLFSALELCKKGLYGSANMLLRNVYEGLIIVKYTTLSEDRNLIDNWLNGKTIKFKESIFDKLKSPKSKAANKFWVTLCSLTHMTINAQQITIDKYYVNGTIAIIKMLLIMNFDLFVHNVLDHSQDYYLKRYNQILYDMLIDKKRECRKLSTIFKKKLSQEGKEVISAYTSEWILK